MCPTVAVTIMPEHHPTAACDHIRQALFLYGPDIATSLRMPAVYTRVEDLTSIVIISLKGFSVDIPPEDNGGGRGFRFRRQAQDGNSSFVFVDGAIGGNDGSGYYTEGSGYTDGNYNGSYTGGSGYADDSYGEDGSKPMGDSETGTFESVLKKFLWQRLQSMGVDVTTTKVMGQHWVFCQ